MLPRLTFLFFWISFLLTFSNLALLQEQATPTKTSFMMDDLLDKKKTPSKPEEKIPKKSKKQLETEELDFLLAQSLAGGSIGASVRTRRSRVNRGASAGDDSSPNKSSNSDPKIKPKHMKKSTAQPAKFNLKKHQKKKSYAISSSDEEDNPAVNIDPEDLKPENISEPAPEPDDLGNIFSHSFMSDALTQFCIYRNIWGVGV